MTTKQAYCPPESEVIDIQTQGFLCESGNTEKFTRGQSYDDSDFDN
jgi:hypothetical protein